MAEDLNITELYEKHLELNATMDAVGDWQMPLYYSGILPETLAMRTTSGVVDRGNESIIRFAGKGATTLLDGRLACSVSAMAIGESQKNYLLNVNGAVIGVLWVCAMAQDDFLILTSDEACHAVSNALAAIVNKSTKLEDLSDYLMRIDIIGPNSSKVLSLLGATKQPQLRSCGTVEFNDNHRAIVISLNEYGEEGFALLFADQESQSWWSNLIQCSEVTPCGILSCEQLRIENGIPALGCEFADSSRLNEFDISGLFEPLSRRFFGRPALERTPAKRRLTSYKLSSDENPPSNISSITPEPNAEGEFSAIGWEA